MSENVKEVVFPQYKAVHLLLPFFAVSMVLLGPIAVSYYLIGSRVIFNLFAADSMYYMGIANNFVKFGVPTLDGETVTNGFHPLWEFMLIAMFKLPAVSHHDQVYVAFFASLLLVYATYLMIAWMLMIMLGRWPGLLAILALFPGVYALCLEPRRHYFGDPGMLYDINPYSAVNGMETSLSLALWSIFFLTLIVRFRFLAQKAPYASYEMGTFFPLGSRICLAALVLSRLDDGFLIAAIGLFLLTQTAYSLTERARALFHVVWPAILGFEIYIVFNALTVGVLLPVSAKAKMTFSFRENFHHLYALFFGHLQNDQWWFIAARMTPIIFSVLGGIMCIGLGWRHRHILHELSAGSFKFLLTIAGYFMAMKGIFLFLWVPLWSQGYWYYFSMILTANAVFACVIASCFKTGNKALVAASFYLMVIVLRMPNDINFLTMSTNNENYADVAYTLWNQGDAIRSFLEEKAPGAKLVDSFDGMFVYLLDMPGPTYTRLVSSPGELEKYKAQGFWQTVIPQGFSIVPDYGYIRPGYVPDIQVVEALHPPSSPVPFLRVELKR